MNYIKLTQGFNNSKFIKEDDLYKSIISYNRDWYTSMFYYTKEHVDQVLSNPKFSVAGIHDLKTNKLWFDFDDKHNLQNAKNDALLVSNKLLSLGFNESNLQICFSGNKGFSIVVETDKMLNPKEVLATCKQIASGISSFDKTMYDAPQVFRVPLTKHQDTGLYKTPLTLQQLKELSIDEIKSSAKDVSDIHPSALKDHWTKAKWPTTLVVQTPIKEVVKPISVALNEQLDYSKKPKFLTNCRWALQNGVFKDGNRSHALLCLASTYKNLGFDLEHVYRLLKGVSELQSRYEGTEDRYPDTELYNNVVMQVFSNTWKGGQYSCRQEGWLQDYCNTLGENSCNHEKNKDVLVECGQVFNMFKSYAENYENNVLYTGIEDLDKHVNLMVGTSNAILAPPSAGKCLGFNTPVIMYDGSIKMVQDVKVGDKLMGDDSTPRKVLSTCKGNETLYKINQDNGDSYVVNESHILSLKCSYTAKKERRMPKYTYGLINDIPLVEYLKKGPGYKKYYKGYKASVEFKPKEITFNPYFLGYWLGNGTSSKSEVSLHKDHLEVIRWMSGYAKSLGLTSKQTYQTINGTKLNLTGYHGTRNKNPIDIQLKKYNIYRNKHIPHEFLTNSRDVRLQVLAGLIDSDGYNNDNRSYEIACSNNELAKQIVWLCRSLGFKSSLVNKNKRYRSITKGKLYEGSANTNIIYITGENLSVIPVLLEYKKIKDRDMRTYTEVTSISVENIGIGDYYGFEIDGNKRFLLGDFTVTHNTSLSLQILNHNSNQDINCIFFSYDMFHAAVYMRMVQKHTGMQQSQVYDMFYNDPKKTHEVNELLKKEYKNVKFCFKSGQTADDIKETILEEERNSGKKIKLAIVDYHDLVMSNYSDGTQASAETAQKLRQIANDTEVCMLTLLQPTKAFSSPADDLTNFNAAKGSGRIVEALTVMLGCSRPGFNPKNVSTDKFFNITCLKNRNGPLFSVDLGWEGLKGQISNLEDHEREELEEIRNKKQQERDEKSNGWT